YVVFLPLGVIAGMGGMSEFSMILSEYGIDWRMGYLVFTMALVVVGIASWWIVAKLVSRWGVTNGSADITPSDRARR
ncbi:MAG: hypothetical protein ACYCYF_03435, partial [Anaerolineae bacterium]